MALQSGLPNHRTAPTNIPGKCALYSVVKPNRDHGMWAICILGQKRNNNSPIE